MEKFRPRHVDRAIKDQDHEAIVAFARAGGRATAEKKKTEREFQDEVRDATVAQSNKFPAPVQALSDEEVHRQSMQRMADERRDDLLVDS